MLSRRVIKIKIKFTESVDKGVYLWYTFSEPKGGEMMAYDVVANGRRLINLRGGRSREEVAAATGISVSALAMYELGQRNPRDEVKCALADYFNVPVAYIFFP
jgi:DNA-binding XRE family transcriptional regulator